MIMYSKTIEQVLYSNYKHDGNSWDKADEQSLKNFVNHHESSLIKRVTSQLKGSSPVLLKDKNGRYFTMHDKKDLKIAKRTWLKPHLHEYRELTHKDVKEVKSDHPRIFK